MYLLIGVVFIIVDLRHIALLFPMVFRNGLCSHTRSSFIAFGMRNSGVFNSCFITKRRQLPVDVSYHYQTSFHSHNGTRCSFAIIIIPCYIGLVCTSYKVMCNLQSSGSMHL